MKPPSKPILIAGGVAVAAGAIWYIRKQEKRQRTESEPAIAAPVTYASSQEGYGNFGNFGGGGAPSGGAPGVTTAPEPTEHKICGPDEQSVGVSAVAGQPGGIRCVPRNPVTKFCPEGKRAVGISAIAGHPGGIRCV